MNGARLAAGIDPRVREADFLAGLRATLDEFDRGSGTLPDALRTRSAFRQPYTAPATPSPRWLIMLLGLLSLSSLGAVSIGMMW